MDFKTRDIYQKRLRIYQLRQGMKNDLGEITINLALPSEHIGEFLLGTKRIILEQKVGFQPDAKTTFKRFIFRHATLIYSINNICFNRPDFDGLFSHCSLT